ncbi:hypothetical protein [Leptospira levettii]|uniref:hypothetical protein n=1 Tax=Leptospira levettii TaxID=2023178 RepID=UPI0014385961|nr:hypothetical protein [Leptospira levettii]
MFFGSSRYEEDKAIATDDSFGSFYKRPCLEFIGIPGDVCLRYIVEDRIRV